MNSHLHECRLKCVPYMTLHVRSTMNVNTFIQHIPLIDHLHYLHHNCATMSSAFAKLAKLRADTNNKRPASSQPPQQSPSKKQDKDIAEKFDVRRHNLVNLTPLIFEQMFIFPSDAVNNFLNTAANRQFCDVPAITQSVTDNYKMPIMIRMEAARVTNNVVNQSLLSSGFREVKCNTRKIHPANSTSAIKVNTQDKQALFAWLCRCHRWTSNDIVPLITCVLRNVFAGNGYSGSGLWIHCASGGRPPGAQQLTSEGDWLDIFGQWKPGHARQGEQPNVLCQPSEPEMQMILINKCDELWLPAFTVMQKSVSRQTPIATFHNSVFRAHSLIFNSLCLLTYYDA